VACLTSAGPDGRDPEPTQHCHECADRCCKWRYSPYWSLLYDAALDSFKPYGKDASFGKDVCYQCHTAVTTRDYIFTSYPRR